MPVNIIFDNERYFFMNVCESFRQIKKNLNLRQVELAERMGIAPAQLSNYVRGTQIPSFETLIRIANNLKISILEFIPPEEKELQKEIIGLEMASLKPDERELLLNYRAISKDKKNTAREVVRSLKS